MFSEIRKALRDNGDAIKIGNTLCKLYDRFHLTQCSKCCNYGHVANNCRKDCFTCTFCSGNHSYKDCDNKDNKASHKCSNCLRSIDANTKANANSHNAFDSHCPVKKSQLNKLISRTDNGRDLST